MLGYLVTQSFVRPLRVPRHRPVWNGICPPKRNFRNNPGALHRDARFKILFMGRDEFSCLVFRELYAARGKLFLSHAQHCIAFTWVPDVWDRIVIATNPDEKTGRRGSQLSICECWTHNLQWRRVDGHSSTSQASRRVSQGSSTAHTTHQARIQALDSQFWQRCSPITLKCFAASRAVRCKRRASTGTYCHHSFFRSHSFFGNAGQLCPEQTIECSSFPLACLSRPGSYSARYSQWWKGDWSVRHWNVEIERRYWRWCYLGHISRGKFLRLITISKWPTLYLTAFARTCNVSWSSRHPRLCWRKIIGIRSSGYAYRNGMFLSLSLLLHFACILTVYL